MSKSMMYLFFLFILVGCTSPMPTPTPSQILYNDKLPDIVSYRLNDGDVLVRGSLSEEEFETMVLSVVDDFFNAMSSQDYQTVSELTTASHVDIASVYEAVPLSITRYVRSDELFSYVIRRSRETVPALPTRVIDEDTEVVDDFLLVAEIEVSIDYIVYGYSRSYEGKVEVYITDDGQWLEHWGVLGYSLPENTNRFSLMSLEGETYVFEFLGAIYLSDATIVLTPFDDENVFADIGMFVQLYDNLSDPIRADDPYIASFNLSNNTNTAVWEHTLLNPSATTVKFIFQTERSEWVTDVAVSRR